MDILFKKDMSSAVYLWVCVNICSENNPFYLFLEGGQLNKTVKKCLQNTIFQHNQHHKPNIILTAEKDNVFFNTLTTARSWP